MKKFEFSYRDLNDDMHFVVVFDDSLVSACERVLGRTVELATEMHESGHGNWFITGWEDTRFTIHELPVTPGVSHHVAMPQSKEPSKQASKILELLEGLT